MAEVPRYEFVPLKYRRAAYANGPLPMGHGQTISQPFIVALMTELLQLQKTHKVLEVGQSGKRVIIAAHGNSLRALVKYLDNISDQEIVGLNIPTGVPLVYELDVQLKPLKHYYLGDPEEVARAAAAVAAQGKAR